MGGCIGPNRFLQLPPSHFLMGDHVEAPLPSSSSRSTTYVKVVRVVYDARRVSYLQLLEAPRLYRLLIHYLFSFLWKEQHHSGLLSSPYCATGILGMARSYTGSAPAKDRVVHICTQRAAATGGGLNGVFMARRVPTYLWVFVKVQGHDNYTDWPVLIH